MAQADRLSGVRRAEVSNNQGTTAPWNQLTALRRTDHPIPRRALLKGALAASAASPFLILSSRTKAAQSDPVPPGLPPSERVNLACKGQEKCRSSFDVSGPLSQVLVLGVIAQRLNTRFTFDRKTQQITDTSVANQLLVGPPPRKGWEEYYRL